MAEKKFSELTAKGSTIADTDLIAISESAGGGTYTSKSVTGANVKALVTDANLTTTDVTTNNVSTSKHGFAPKSPNDGTQFLDGLGAYDTVKDSDLSLSDITTNDVSTTKHGFVPKAPNDTTKFLRGDGTWQTPAAGGLTKFTEAEATTSPNNTVYVDSLTAAGSTTNVDVAIRPKGSGALLGQIPDNGTSGGNKRGAYAVDLCIGDRGNANQVASGSYSAIIGGRYNKASGTASFATGESNSSNGNYSFSAGQSNIANGIHSIALGGSNSTGNDFNIAIGGSNTCTNEYYVHAFGYGNAVSSRGQAVGLSNTCSGLNSNSFGRSNISSAEGATSIGDTNTANGSYSLSLGRQSHSFGITGRQVYASGQESTAGDSQSSKFVLHERTTDATATVLTTNSSAASTTNQVILQNQNAIRFKGTIIGKKSGTTDIAAWDIDGLIVRGANAASTVLNINNVTLVQNTPAWGTPALSADTTNGGLKVEVTGAASTNIQWTAVIETTEVIYA